MAKFPEGCIITSEAENYILDEDWSVYAKLMHGYNLPDQTILKCDPKKCLISQKFKKVLELKSVHPDMDKHVTADDCLECNGSVSMIFKLTAP